MRKLSFIYFLLFLSFKGIAQLGISPTGNRTLCSGDSLRLSITGLNSSVTYVFKWFKDGATISDSTKSSLLVKQSGKYKAVIEYGGTNSDTTSEVTLTINPKPTAGFSFNQPSGCGTKSIQFSNNSLDGSGGSNLTYFWDFGNGKTSTDKNPSMTFKPGKGNSSDVFNVQLKVRNADGCIDSIKKQITIGQTPDATLGGDNPSDFNGKKYFKFCQSEAGTFVFSNLSSTISTNTSYRIKWGDSNPDTLFSTFPVGTFINHTYPVGIKTLVFYVYNGTCVDSTEYNIFIGNYPAGGLAAPNGRNLCAGDSLPFFIRDVAENPPGTRYIFFVNDNSIPDTFYHPAPDTVRHTFKISSCGFSSGPNYPNSFIAILNISNPCNVLGTEGTINPTIVSDKPKPVISVSPRDTSCIGQTITFTNIGSPGNNVQNGICTPGKLIWKIFPATGWSGQNLGSTNGQSNPANWTSGSNSLPVTFNAAGVYEVRLIMANNTLCGMDSVVKMICVNPIPAPALTFNNNSICTGSSVSPLATLNTPTCGNYTYTWTVSYTASAGCLPATGSYQITNANTLNPNIRFDNPGTYTIFFSAVAPGGACSTVVSKPILVRGKPSVTLSPIPSFCLIDSISPKATISCMDSVASYSWTFQDGIPATSNNATPGIVKFLNSGTKQIQITVTNSCGTTVQSSNVTVNPMPVVSSITGASSLCVGSQTIFTGPTGGVWSSASPSIATISSAGVVSGIAAGTATIRYTVTTNGCSTVVSKDITVYALPTLTLQAISDICNTATSFSIPFINSSNGAATYDLTAGPTNPLPNFVGITDASLSGSPLNISLSGLALNAGSYGFTLKIKNNAGCSTTYSNVVLKIAAPPSVANAGPDISQCAITSFAMAAEAPTIGSGIWSLVSGNATILTPSSRTTSVTNLAAGNTATLRWTVNNTPCPTSSDDIIITNNLVPAITLGTVASICNTATSFSLPYTNPVNGAATYDLVAATTKPLPGFAGILGAGLGASPLIIDLSGLSLTAGTYDFILRVKNGSSCQSSNNFSLTIAAPPSVANAGPDISQCNSGTFTMAALAPAIGIGSWSLVSGSASIVNPSLRTTGITNLASGSSATLRWTVSNNPCPSSSDDIVIQNISAVGSPTISGNFINCNIDTFFLNGSTPVSGQTGLWSLISGSAILPSDVTTPTIQVTGVPPGTSAVLRWNISNTLCNSSKDVTISNRAPILNNIIGPDQTICGSQVSIAGFTPTGGGLAGVNPVLTYQWQFRIGSGSWTNIPTPVGTVKDLLNYSINQSISFRRLVTGLTCTDTSNLSNVTVQPSISNNNISFSQTLCNGQDPSELIGSLPSGGGTTNYIYEWQLNTGNGIWSKVGDGINYDPIAIQVTGNSSITYSYRRLVSSPDCPTATPLISNTITVTWNPDGKAEFNALALSRCAPFGISLGNNIGLVQYNTRNTQYNWRLIKNDGSGTLVQSLDNSLTPPTYSLNFPNQSIILQLVAVGANGCKNDTIQKIFTTSDNPVVSFTGDIDSSCSPMVVKMTNSTYFGSPGNASGLSFQWYVNGVLQSSASNPVLTLINPGNKNDEIIDVKLIASIQASSSCKDSASNNFRVLPLPLSQFSIINGDTCSNPNGIVKRVQNTSIAKVGNVTYSWRVIYSNGDRASSVSISDTTALSPLFIFPTNNGTKDTTYTIILEVRSPDNCIRTSTQNITIFRQPSVKFGLSQQEGCSPLSITISDSTNNVSHTKQWSSFANVSGAPVVRFSNLNVINPVITVPDNPLDTTIFYVIRQIATSGSGCKDTLEKIIKVFPKPQVSFTIPSSEGCTPYALTATSTSTAGNSEPFSSLSHQWRIVKGNTLIASAFSPAISAVLTNTGIVDSTYDIWLVVTNKNGCKDSLKKTITVHGNAKAEFLTRNAVGCIPFRLKNEITLRTFPDVNSIYKWTVNGVSYPTGITPPDYTINKDGDSAIVLLESVSRFGCQNEFYVDTFYTIKTPTPSFSKSITEGCGPLVVTFINNSVPLGGINYNWQFGNGQTSQQLQPGPVTFLASPLYRDTVYTITLTASTTCTSVQFKDSIFVRSKPIAIAAPDSTRLCSPVTVNFNNFSKGARRNGSGMIYYWSFGDGGLDTTYTNTPVKHTYYNNKAVPDTFIMKLNAVNECGVDSNFYKIVVLPNSVVSELVVDGNSKTGCAPFSVKFYNRSAGATSYKWDYGDGTTLFTTVSPDEKTHIYAKAGTYRISLFATNGCSDSTTFEQITVLDPVAPSFTTDKSSYCDYDSVRFNNTTASVSVNTFEWDFGDGTRSFSRNPVHKYTDSGLYKVVLTAKNVDASGIVCQDIFEKYIRIYRRPDSKINLPALSSFCAPIELEASIDSQSAPNIKWIFEDGLNTDTVYNTFTSKHLYKENGVFKIRVSIKNSAGCQDSSSTFINIQETPITKFTFPDSVFCINSETQKAIVFTNQTIVPNGQTYSYQWLIDGKIVSTDRRQLSYDFVINSLTELPKYYLVTLRSLSSNGCSKDSTIRIRLVPYPKARLSVNSKINCYNSVISVSDQDKETIHTRKWSIRSLGGSPEATFENDTASISKIYTPLNRSGSIYSYEIKLEAITQGRCIDSVRDTIFVYPEPAILFTLPDTLCANQQQLVKNLSLPLAGTSQSQMSYSWKLRRYNTARDTITILISDDLDLVFTTLNSGILDSTYFLTLSGVTPQGCTASFTKKFVVKSRVKAEFTFSPSISCSPARLSITTNDSRNAVQYKWYINDQLYSDLVKPNDTILRRGGTSYTVKLLALSGSFCNNDSVSYKVITYEPPVASFDISDTSSCTGILQPFISDRSYGIGTDIIKWNWNFGDGTSSSVQNPSKQYNVPGLYKLSLSVQDRKGCISDTVTRNITIYGKPKALFTVSDICIGDSIQPINKSILGFGSTKFETINWNFGDGNSSTLFEPRYKYSVAGDFTVRLIVYSDKSCIPDTVSQRIRVVGKPVATVSWDIQCRALPIQFNSLSSAGFGDQIGRYQWSWGDGDFSILKDPIKSFRDTGKYKVKLIVSGTICPYLKDTTEKIIFISNPRASMTYPIKYVAMAKPYQLTAEPGGLKYYWTPGTGLDNPLKKDPIAKYQLSGPGKVFYSIEITDTSGCKIFDKQEVWVFEQPDIFLPTAFTPNGDGVNDVFRPLYVNIASIKYFRIFDRRGNIVIQTADMNFEWNGTTKGKYLPMDTYTWVISAVDKDGKELFRKGNVTLIRKE